MLTFFKKNQLIIKGYFKSRTFSLSFAISIVFFTVFFILFTPRFNTNDDLAMMFAANGFSYGTPYQSLVFTNITIGWLLKLLYTVIPNIAWYTLYLYFFHFVSCLIIFSTLFISQINTAKFIFFTSSFLLFELQMLMNLQFTSTSLMLGFSTILYYFVSNLKNVKNNWFPLFSGLILGISSFIRSGSFIGTLLFGFPLVLYSFKKFSLRKNIIFGSSALSTFSLSKLTNSLYYNSNQDWTNFFTFNKVRGSLHGTPKLDWDQNVIDILNKIHWSQNDFFMFQQWFYTDRNIFSLEALKTFAKYRHLEAPLTLSLNKMFTELSQSFPVESIYILLFFIFLLLLAKNNSRIFLVMLLIWNLLVCFYLINFARFPPRIAIPFFLFISLSLLFYAEVKPLSYLKNKRFLNIVSKLACMVSILLFFTFNWLHNPFLASRDNANDHQDFIATVESLNKLNSKAVFVHWGASLAVERCSPFTTKKDLPKLKLIGLGWQINSPPFIKKLRQLQIDDLYDAIATRNDIYLIADEYLVGLYEQFMLEHYGKVVKLRNILTLDGINVFHN